MRLSDENLARLRTHLQRDYERGDVYVKSRKYTDVLDASVQEVGNLMAVARQRGWVEMYAKTRAHTWRITEEVTKDD